MAITDREGTYTSDARYLHQRGMEWFAHTYGESSEYHFEVGLVSTLRCVYSGVWGLFCWSFWNWLWTW